MSLIKANAHQVGDYTLTNEGGKLVVNQGTPDTVLNPVATFGLDGLEVDGKLLSGTSGSSLVGYDTGTVQDVLDGAKSLQDYAVLRAYTGRASRVYITGLLGTVKPAGNEGFFQYDQTDTTSADNNGTVVVLADGRRFKRVGADRNVHLAWFLADRFGVSDIRDALANAVAHLGSIGGGTIYGDASDTYRLDTGYTVSFSNITIDLRGGRLIGSGLLKFSGENGIDGDWTGALERVFFKNARVGSGATSITMTPIFIYCVDSGMDQVHKHSYGDTGVNMFMCRRTHFKNMTIRGGKTIGASFAALMLHCEDSTFQDIVALEGPFTYVFQIKGGENCRGIRCIGRDISPAGSVSTDYGFYIRGDAPWGASPTTGYSYPYHTGSWGAADEKRATRNSYFEECELINTACNFSAFHAQEFVDAGFILCTDAATAGSGFTASRAVNGNERGFKVSECKGKRSTENLDGAGVNITSNHASNINGVIVNDCEVEGYGYNGFLFRNAKVSVKGNTAKNCCGKNLTTYSSAFAAELGSSVSYIGNTAIDDRATKYHAYGFLADSSCKSPIVDGNTVEGFTTRPFAISRPAKFSANVPGELSLQTISGIAVTGGTLIVPYAGEVVWIEASVTGVDLTGVVGVWKIGGLFKNVGGTVSQEGSTAQIVTAINPGTWGGVAFQIVSNSVRLAISGKAGTTINWVGDLRMTYAI